MKFIARFLYVPLAGLLVLTSCAKDETESYDKFENQALEAWMTQHRSDLVENLQSEGLYYVDLLDAGDLASDPINTEDIWVSFDFSGRDLSGNIILTRNADDAVLAGSFSKYTHYVPFYRYCGSENSGLMEGTWLAMRRTLTLGDTYFRNNKDRLGITSPEVTLRYGSKIRLYMPSSVVGNGVEGTGGYEGQEGYSLSSKRPFIVTMEIRDTVSNPLEREGTDVDDFCELNGGLQIYSKGDDDTPATEVPEDPEDPEHPYNETSKRWVSACDSIPQVYVNVRYNPAEPGDQLSFPAPYHVGYEPYVSEASVRDIDMQIAEALKTFPRRGRRLREVRGGQETRSRFRDARRHGQNLVYRPFSRRVHLRHEHRRGEEDHLRRGRANGYGARIHPVERRDDPGVLLRHPQPQVRPVGGAHHHVDQRLRFVGQERLVEFVHFGVERLFVELPRLSQLPQLRQ